MLILKKKNKAIGTIIYFFQGKLHISYILYLQKILSNAGYCNKNIPVIQTGLGVKEKVQKIGRSYTWT